MFRVTRLVLFSLIAACSLLFSGCVYFNTFFNAQKAYDKALRLREIRLSKNPEDTVLLTDDEKAQLERAITKCSKVLELYPDKIKYAPKALFLMGESYLLMQDYEKAVEQYDELAQYYPQSPQMPLASIHRARALYLEGQVIKARNSAAEILKTNPKGEILHETLLLMAKMEVEGDSASVGIDYYEKLLQEKDLDPEVRAGIHWEAAKLAFDLGQWERARQHALCEERKVLPDVLQYRNDKLALICLNKEKKFKEGVDEGQSLYKKRGNSRFRPELNNLIAQDYAGLGDWKTADNLYRLVPKMAPKTSASSEAFYRLGDHFFDVLHKEDSARVYFDSSAAAGSSFPFAQLAALKSKALSRIADLRKTNPDSTTQPQYSNFMIAELFLFNLSQVDSSLARLNRIVHDTTLDSTYTVRAAYARAYIEDEYKNDTAKSDEYYRYVMQKFPRTEWAKQSEKNLGLKPTVVTDEDEAHALFLAAEKLNFGGADISSEVIPAYREVVRQYPNTPDAAQALFVIAFLRESQAHQDSPVPGSLDSAKIAYHNLTVKYPKTIYGQVAADKMQNVNLPKSAIDSVFAKPKVDTTSLNAVPDTSPADTSEEDGKKRKEVLEPKLDDQY